MGMARGRSDHLWSKSFFAGCLQRLKHGGILSTQLGACLLRPDGLALSPTVAAGLARLKQAGFQTARAYTAEIPSYGGLAVFGMASNGASQQESCLALLASSACRVAGRADATEVPPWRSRAAARGLEGPQPMKGVADSIEAAFSLPAALAAAIDADADADASGLATEAEETRSQSSEQDRQEKSCMQQRRRLFSFFLSNAGSTCVNYAGSDRGRGPAYSGSYAPEVSPEGHSYTPQGART
ncbi:speE [Symbiodinium necroappetens]|uniref:SpeE protein n=1 Tax=Symbiodinium necroappetens TaxID=1628268 RepID=A0A813B189_9DINO|nr:speE [Symbiodinium necroappetens]